MEILYCDESLVVAVKPAGVLSTDEPGGMPALVRACLGGEGADVRTVHRLDRVVGGLMVLARSPEAASLLSRQITDGSFRKEYLAVTHFCPHAREDSFTDLLARDPAERKTYVVKKPGKDVRSATLHYKVLAAGAGLSLIGRACHGPHPSDPRAVFLPRSAACRRPEIRSLLGRLSDRAVVVPSLLRPSVYRRKARV